MAKTTAERQAAYRERHRMVGLSGERRLNTWVSTTAHWRWRGSRDVTA